MPSQEEMRELLDNQRKLIAQNEQLIRENKELKESFAGSAPITTRRNVTERKVELRTVDGKVVVGYRNRGTPETPQYVYERLDPKDSKRTLLYVDLVLEGEPDQSLSVDYKEFRRNSGRALATVVSIREEEWFITQGVTTRKTVPEGKYHTEDSGEDVIMDVVGKTRFFNVRLPAEQGGRTLEVHENFINIA